MVLQLNPYDPANFSMHTAQATSLVHQKKYKKAANLIVKAADDPNAYFTIQAMATAILEIAGRSELAQRYAIKTLQLKPEYSVEVISNTPL